MGREASAQREKQEQSIKARKNELFVEEEVQAGPQKRLRDYVKETPAAPLSKNVKLTLWGSAAPVVLLFVIAILVPRRSNFKKPEDMVIPVHPTKPALASRSTVPVRAVGASKTDGPGPGAAADSSKSPQDKAKAKPKKKPTKKSNTKAKPKKDETAVAQNTEGEKPKDGDEANAEKSGDKAKGKAKGKTDEAKDPSKSGSSTTDSKGKSTTPDKAKKKAAPILVKKKKDYNPAYPPRTPTGEKKADDTDAGFP
jgi:hypothetical protein